MASLCMQSLQSLPSAKLPEQFLRFGKLPTSCTVQALLATWPCQEQGNDYTNTGRSQMRCLLSYKADILAALTSTDKRDSELLQKVPPQMMPDYDPWVQFANLPRLRVTCFQCNYQLVVQGVLARLCTCGNGRACECKTVKQRDFQNSLKT